MMKVNQLVGAIREKHGLNLGEACALLNVGPSQIRREYAPAVCDLAIDVRWDGKRFETVVQADPVDQAQKRVEDYMRGGGSHL